jgi:hypothetical protein
MTPQNLIDVARELNPEKLASDPPAALKDAYLYYEALQLLTNQKQTETPSAERFGGPIVSVKEMNSAFRKSYGLEAPDIATNPADVAMRAKLRRRNKASVVDRLRTYLDEQNDSIKEVSKTLGVGFSTVHFWLKGRHKPNSGRQELLDRFLAKKGY